MKHLNRIGFATAYLLALVAVDTSLAAQEGKGTAGIVCGDGSISISDAWRDGDLQAVIGLWSNVLDDARIYAQSGDRTAPYSVAHHRGLIALRSPVEAARGFVEIVSQTEQYKDLIGYYDALRFSEVESLPNIPDGVEPGFWAKLFSKCRKVQFAVQYPKTGEVLLHKTYFNQLSEMAKILVLVREALVAREAKLHPYYSVEQLESSVRAQFFRTLQARLPMLRFRQSDSQSLHPSAYPASIRFLRPYFELAFNVDQETSTKYHYFYRETPPNWGGSDAFMALVLVNKIFYRDSTLGNLGGGAQSRSKWTVAYSALRSVRLAGLCIDDLVDPNGSRFQKPKSNWIEDSIVAPASQEAYWINHVKTCMSQSVVIAH